MDMFWGDRCGMLTDPNGYHWMIGTHKSEPTPKEMRAKMKEQMQQMQQQPAQQQPPEAAAASAG